MASGLLTIVVPVYKVEAYLDICVSSIVNQTYKNLEIILVDDGSPDNCPKLCDEWASKDNRIRVIHRKNGGLSAARNDGLRSSNGEYLLFVDSDDFLEIDACERLMNIANGEDVILGEATIVENGKSIPRVHTNLKENYIYTGPEYVITAVKKGEWFAAVCYNMYRIRFLKENNLFFMEGVLHEDNEFTPRLCLAAKTVKYCHYRFYNYIIRGDSITGHLSQKHYDDLMKIYSSWYHMNTLISDKKTKKIYSGVLAKSYIYTCRTHKKLEVIYPEGMNATYLVKNALNFKELIKAFIFIMSRKLYYKL